MSSCIICGTSVDGHICDVHEEDVVFEFRGSSPEELTPGRYYRGSVDGFAEFGVFVDVGDSVTGLLHESELDQRLESLEWQPGDAVYVRVTNVRDNGNVDLSWSIRQAESAFRGLLIDDPEADHELLPEETDETDTETSDDEPTTDDESTTAGAVRTRDSAETDVGAVGTADAGTESTEETTTETETEETSAETETEETTTEPSAEAEESSESVDAEADAIEDERTPEPPTVAVEDLDGWIGETVRLTGEITDARQTSGPTVFELRDGTGSVDCAAFVEAGVRAYPSVEEGDIVRLDGEVRERRGELQVETDDLEKLTDDDREDVLAAIDATLTERARPEEIDPLVDDEAVAAEAESIRDVVGEIRRAVLEDRPVIVRHSATTDGYVGAAAIERAVLPLVRDRHDRRDAEYHYIDRRPLEGDVYDLEDATADVTRMLDDRERHDENLPLLVFVGVGGTEQSLDGFELLEVYDASNVVVDSVVEPAIAEAVDGALAPNADATEIAVADGTTRGPTATALAATVGAHVAEAVREDLRHLPAVSYWGSVPEAYADAAAEAGYDEQAVAEIREAVALEAYYQSYEDKRELVTDLLFDGRDTTEADVSGLASHVSEQFREKLTVAVETAEANLERRTVDGETIGVLDIDQFTHTYDFPPATLLLDELYRNSEGLTAIVGIDEDELHVRSGHALDVREIATTASESVANADLAPLSTRSHRIEFLAGQRSAVLDAVLAAIADSV